VILRELGAKLAEIATLPVQEEKKRLWREHNDLRTCRPLVCIDQLPWHELNINDELTLVCEDPFLRNVEHDIRRILYKWHHFPADMIVENRVDIPKTINGLRYGLDVVEQVRILDSANDVMSHKYEDQCVTLEALEALKPDIITVDNDLDRQHLDICSEIFQGIIPVRLSGVSIHAGVWDRIAQARPAGAIMNDIVEDPDLIMKTAEKFRDLTLTTIEQCEKLCLLDAGDPLVHCSYTYTDDLPASGYDPAKARAKDCWAYGMAQIFSMVSPAMHEEFEIDVMKPLYGRFGLLYYGCCEPLEKKIDIIRKIGNVRKISISPWANIESCAEQIGSDYVFSGKAHPVHVTSGNFNNEAAYKQINHMREACKRNNTPCEIILKDISTVSYNPQVLSLWENMVMRLVQEI